MSLFTTSAIDPLMYLASHPTIQSLSCYQLYKERDFVDGRLYLSHHMDEITGFEHYGNIKGYKILTDAIIQESLSESLNEVVFKEPFIHKTGQDAWLELGFCTGPIKLNYIIYRK
jgi:hypothetical protein